MDFLVQKFINHCNGLASTKSIEMLISHKEDTISQLVFEKLPKIQEEECRIYGSLDIIKMFNEIDNEKIDYYLSLEDVKFSNIVETGLELLLFIAERNEEITIETIYDSDRKLLEKFDLSKYFKYCLSINRADLAIYNLIEMLDMNKEKEFQFRTIKNNDVLYLRSITTNVYKNYDNHIALYLMFTSCHNYAKENNSSFIVKNSFISDSNLVVNILLDKVVKTKVNGLNLKVGVRLYNNEISEGSLAMYFYYYAENQFGQGFNAISNSVFKIAHTNRAENIEFKLDNLSNLNIFTNEIVRNLEIVDVSKNLSSTELFEIFENFIHKADVSKLQKQSFKKLQEEITEQTFNLITLFDKIDKLIEESDIDKKLVLHKVFNDYIRSKAE